jgi:hypothetical protein
MAAGDVDLGILSTPSELKAAADRIDAEIRAMDDAIDGNEEIPQPIWDSWSSFWARWKAFYNSNFSSPVWSWLTTRLGDLSDQLETWTADAKNFAGQFQNYGTEIPGGVLNPAAPFSLSDLANPLKGFGITVDVALLLIVVGLVVWKGMK